MNKKKLRQMSASLLRRLTTQPTVQYLSNRRGELTALLEDESFLQRFAPLFDGTRISCAAVLDLAREEMDRLSPEPEEG